MIQNKTTSGLAAKQGNGLLPQKFDGRMNEAPREQNLLEKCRETNACAAAALDESCALMARLGVVCGEGDIAAAKSLNDPSDLSSLLWQVSGRLACVLSNIRTIAAKVGE